MAAGGERRFQQGEHICAIYDDPDEQVGVAADYIAEGLRCDEQCLYVAETSEDVGRFRAALSAAGVDVAAAEAERALILRRSSEAHLATGEFSSEVMLGLLNDMVESALDAGFTGLRACGDMSWLLGDPPGGEQVVEYEALLNPFFRNIRALGMCQYDRARLPAGLLDHALSTHSSVTVNGAFTANPFYKPPAVSRTRQARPDDVHWKIRELGRGAERGRR